MVGSNVDKTYTLRFYNDREEDQKAKRFTDNCNESLQEYIIKAINFYGESKDRNDDEILKKMEKILDSNNKILLDVLTKVIEDKLQGISIASDKVAPINLAATPEPSLFAPPVETQKPKLDGTQTDFLMSLMK